MPESSLVKRIALAAVLASAGCGSGSNERASPLENMSSPRILVDGPCTNLPEDCGVKVCIDCTVNAPPGSEPACVAGKCVFPCAAGFHDCGGSCFRDDDGSACGASCKACGAPPNGFPACTGGACDFICQSGLVKRGSVCLSPSFSMSY